MRSMNNEPNNGLTEPIKNHNKPIDKCQGLEPI